MRLIISFAALYLSVVLLQLSTGGVGPLDALSGLALNFSNAQIGLLGSAHFFGFFIGCWWAPRMMGNVGHSRAFAVFTTTGVISLLAHMLWLDPYAWALMRVLSGLCVAGTYTVIEAWLQGKVTNETRGRTMGAYRLVDISASLAAQLVISVLEPAAYLSYNLLALLCCLAILPLTMTKEAQPSVPTAPRLRPMLAIARSPLAAAGVVVAGLSNAAIRMVGPLYGEAVGLAIDQIAWFLAAFVFGGALAQYPVGWLADKYDRRWVLVWLSVAAILSCGAMILFGADGFTASLITIASFGLTSYPIYSVSAAHAHDFASNDERVELSAALMFFYALGAIASPYLSSVLIGVFGAGALFALIALGHGLLIVFGLIRMRIRPTVTERTPYVYAPRTTFTVGRLFGRTRDRR